MSGVLLEYPAKVAGGGESAGKRDIENAVGAVEQQVGGAAHAAVNQVFKITILQGYLMVLFKKL